MTDTLVSAVALFVIVTAATLCLTATLAPDPAVRSRAKTLLLQIFHGRKSS